MKMKMNESKTNDGLMYYESKTNDCLVYYESKTNNVNEDFYYFCNIFFKYVW